MNNQLSIKTYFQSDLVKDKFAEVLGKKAPAFIASMLSAVSTNAQLAKADPQSVYSAAMIAATLDLPINPNLGFAYIIPYNQNSKVKQVNEKTGKEVEVWEQKTIAQFQMGYKGFVQLAQRSGQFATINATDVRAGEIEKIDRLTGEITFTWQDDRENLPVIGYVSFMKLINGFEKSLYMTSKELSQHGVKYSKSFAKYGTGLWKDNFDAMAKKTVIKLLLSKYAPLTTDMQTATLADQAIIKDENDFEYVDNTKDTPEETAAEKERARITKFIADAGSIAVLKQCEEHIVDEETRKLFDDKYNELENKEASK